MLVSVASWQSLGNQIHNRIVIGSGHPAHVLVGLGWFVKVSFPPTFDTYLEE